MKKTTVLFLLMAVASAYAQDLKTTVDNTLLNQGLKGINAIKLRNTFHSVIDSLRVKPTKTNLGLSNVDNTSDINKPISSATQIALNAKENSLIKGNITSNDITITGGTGAIIGSGVVLTLSSNGRIRHFTGAGDVTNTISSQANIGDIYFDTTNGTVYQKSNLSFPSGITYIALPSGTWVKLGDYILNKSKIGLGNVDNTSDIDKPISSATQIALNAKENSLIKGNITSNDITITGGTGAIIGSGVVLTLSSNGRIRHFTGAGDVTNTISSQANIGDIYFDTTNGTVYQKSNLSFPSGITYITLPSGTWVKLGDYILNKSKIGLGNVDNTSDIDKPISSATQIVLDTKLNSSTAASTYLPLSGGTLTGSLVFQYGIRTGGTGNTDGNTFFGRNSFISRTSGVNNTALGANTLSSLTTGSNNVIIGNNTGASITTGSDNILIGNALGSSITTGSSNINIGGRLIFNTAGALQLPTYTTAGFLKNDGSGNITSDANAYLSTSTASSTYLPISNPTATGTATLPTIVNTLGANFATSSGNVGIGTASPLAKADIRGDVHISNSSTTKTRIRTGGIIDFTNFAESAYADAAITANNLSLLGGSGVGAYITNAGSFGVGISSPSSKLHVYGTGYVAATIQTTATNAGAITNYITGSRSYSIGGRSDFATGAFHITDETAASSRFMINNGGFVGINTTSPVTQLHINTTATTAQPVARFETTGLNSRPYVDFKGDGTDLGYMGWGSTGNNIMYIMSYLNSDIRLGTNSSTRMTINGTGNVGIGTTSPNKKLEVANAGETSIRLNNTSANTWDIVNDAVAGSFQLIRGGSNTYFHIGNTGNVGIGTTSPSTLLHTAATSQQNLISVESSNATPTLAGVTKFGQNNRSGLNYRGEFQLLLQSFNGTSYYDNEVLTAKHDGKIGIGVSTPNATLDVYSGVNSSAGQFNSAVSARKGGNSYEFGHPNTSGYGSSIGANFGNGFPFIAFNAETGTTTNTYKTRGILGRIITNDVNTNTLIFGRVSNSNADNQSITNDLIINSTGNTGIGTTTPEQRLHVEGLIKTKGYTTTEINALTGMTAGTLVYNTTLNMFCFYNGSAWKRMDGTTNM